MARLRNPGIFAGLLPRGAPNALCAADPMTGHESRTAYALPYARLRELTARYRPGA